MISIAAASRLYENCAKLQIKRVLVEDPVLASIFQLVHDLHRKLGDLRVEESARFRALFKFQRWLTRAPLHPARTGVPADEVVASLRDCLLRINLIKPEAAPVIRLILEQVQQLVTTDRSPLREAVLDQLRKAPGATVLVNRANMVGLVQNEIFDAGLSNRVIRAGGSSDIPFIDEAVLIGPLDEYPDHLFLSPAIPVLHCIAHSWKWTEPAQPRLPEAIGACTALASSPRAALAGLRSSVDLELLMNRISFEEMDLSESTYSREKVDARLVRLAGDHFMFIEAGGGVRTFQITGLAQDDSAVEPLAFIPMQLEVEDLEAGMYLLERTRGATPVLEAVAESLMKDERDMERLQLSQAMWKETLQQLIYRLGLGELSKLLVESGCVTAKPYLLDSWTRSDTILPGDDECLRKILTLADKSTQEIEAALEAGRAHRSMRIKAGMRISELLAERLPTAINREKLTRTGLDEVSLDRAPGAPKMKLLRVEGVDALVSVMRGQLRIVYSGLSDAEKT